MKTRKYHVKEHLWKLPGFSLSARHMGTLKTIVTIGTKTKAGELMWPDRYVIKTKFAKSCNTCIRKGVSLYEISFSDCKVIPRLER